MNVGAIVLLDKISIQYNGQYFLNFHRSLVIERIYVHCLYLMKYKTLFQNTCYSLFGSINQILVMIVLICYFKIGDYVKWNYVTSTMIYLEEKKSLEVCISIVHSRKGLICILN